MQRLLLRTSGRPQLHYRGLNEPFHITSKVAKEISIYNIQLEQSKQLKYNPYHRVEIESTTFIR